MRYGYGLIALMLFAALPVLYVPAAPAPEPYGILEIEPPPKEWESEKMKGESAEEYRKRRIDVVINGLSRDVWHDPEIRKFASITAMKEPWNWISKNLRVIREGEGNRLRISFRAGNRDEQVAIINSLMRVYVKTGKDRQKWWEDALSRYEKGLIELEKNPEKDREYVILQRKGADDARTKLIPNCRAAIARYKQIAVIKWAK